MQTARYVLALWCVALFPPAVLYWLALHPFVTFWRRRGPSVTFATLVGGVIGLAAMAVVFREPLMSVDYGFRWPLALAGLVLIVVGSVFDKKAKEHLTFPVLAGVPELRGVGEPEALLTEGIYARVRHPRYTGVVFSLVGVTLITNYLSLYVVAALSILGLWGVTVLEERELLARFGPEYRRYMDRVPRFLPRRRAD